MDTARHIAPTHNTRLKDSENYEHISKKKLLQQISEVFYGVYSEVIRLEGLVDENLAQSIPFAKPLQQYHIRSFLMAV